MSNEDCARPRWRRSGSPASFTAIIMAVSHVGTAAIFRRFDLPWPPTDVWIDETRHDEMVVRMLFFPDRHIGLSVVDSSGGEIASGKTERVNLSGQGWVVLFVMWENGRAWCVAEERRLRDWTEGGSEPVLVVTQPDITGPIDSFIDPAATRVCHNALTKRVNWWASAPARSGHRQLSIEEDVNALRRALQLLGSHLTLFRAGHAIHISDLRNDLRLLIVFVMQPGKSIPKNSYKPLLLRVAARLRLPLPVYVRTELDPRALPRDAQVLIQYDSPSIRQRPWQGLQDLQDWLTFEMHVDSSAGAGARHTNASFIAELANKLGGAHYDDAMPEALGARQASTIQGTSAVDIFLVEAGDTVLALGRYVLDVYDAQPKKH